MKVNCGVCGKPFTTYPRSIKRGQGKYCSRICMGLAKDHGVRIPVSCPNCGKVNQLKKSDIGRKLFCNSRCRKQYRYPWVPYNCRNCGKKYLTKKFMVAKGQGQHCSDRCYRDWYSKNCSGANSAHWRGGVRGRRIPRVMKEEVYNRDGGMCQYCGVNVTKREARYDHMWPDVMCRRNDIENIVLACNHCNSRKWSKFPDEFGIIPRQWWANILSGFYEEHGYQFHPNARRGYSGRARWAQGNVL